jgi:hypothetical protein
MSNHTNDPTGALAGEFHPTRTSPTATQEHGPLAAPLSDRTLAKVLSRPAHVPRETPSIVELDRQEARARVLDAAFIYEDASRGRDVEAEIAARDAFFARVRECRKVVLS